jgi:hypothetical protein
MESNVRLRDIQLPSAFRRSNEIDYDVYPLTSEVGGYLVEVPIYSVEEGPTDLIAIFKFIPNGTGGYQLYFRDLLVQ